MPLPGSILTPEVTKRPNRIYALSLFSVLSTVSCCFAWISGEMFVFLCFRSVFDIRCWRGNLHVKPQWAAWDLDGTGETGDHVFWKWTQTDALMGNCNKWVKLALLWCSFALRLVSVCSSFLGGVPGCMSWTIVFFPYLVSCKLFYSYNRSIHLVSQVYAIDSLSYLIFCFIPSQEKPLSCTPIVWVVCSNRPDSYRSYQ